MSKIVIEADTLEELSVALADMGIKVENKDDQSDSDRLALIRGFIESMYFGKRQEAEEILAVVFPAVDETFIKNYVARMFEEFFFGIEEHKVG